MLEPLIPAIAKIPHKEKEGKGKGRERNANMTNEERTMGEMISTQGEMKEMVNSRKNVWVLTLQLMGMNIQVILIGK